MSATTEDPQPAARRPRLEQHRDFMRLWGAQIGSAFGSRITRTALPIIAILSIGASPTEIAILSALGVAPGLLVGLLAGGRIDRSAKRPLLIAADLVRAGLILTIPLAAALGGLSMPQLYVVAALVGAATTLFQIADNSFLPSLIGRDLLIEGNARLEATESVAEAAGPAMAGVLVELLTAPFAVIVDAISYLWSAVLLAGIRTAGVPSRREHEATSVGSDLGDGFRVCWAQPLVRATLLADAVMSFFGGFFLALYMLMALDTLGLSPGATGAIIGIGGVGSFVGAALALPLHRRFGAAGAMTLALGVGQAASLFIPLALLVPSFAVVLLVAQQLIGDAFLSAYVVHAISLRQRELPDAVLARANATFHVVAAALLPAGALVAGPLAAAAGMKTAIVVGACGGLLAVPLLAARLRDR